MRDELLSWCCDALQCDLQNLKIEPLTGDAGFRKYFRIFLHNSSYIVVDAPPEHIDNPVFASIAYRLEQCGVIVPSIIAKDFNRGFLILGDLGDNLLLNKLNPDNVDHLYRKALKLIIQMQSCDTQGIATYDRLALRREMDLFNDWFVKKLLSQEINEHATKIIDNCFKILEEQALHQQYRFVHRDFHSRNILLFADELATIDFQDAIVGPITYDAVSLLKDCYIRWPSEQVNMWLKFYHDELIAYGVIPEDTKFSDTQKGFHLIGLQRHLKVFGIFARLSLRDGKHQYLHDLPLVISYTLEALRLYAKQFPSLGVFLTWFETHLMPIIKDQEWFNEQP